MPEPLSDANVAQIEASAIEFARQAGLILTGYFGTPLRVEYKDENASDPVTLVDTEVQEYLVSAISKQYVDHGVIGEEGAEQADSAAPDWVWVLDPLDGTKNFVNGMPVFSCSIGVLYRGAPVVGAIFISWPNEGGGVVMHARKGGGAFAEGEPISVFQSDEPRGGSLVTLPGSFGAIYRFRKPMRGKIGDVRITGSIAYDLAMTAKGVLQYSMTAAPRLWDVAGGSVLVMEAGGVVMEERRAARRMSLSSHQMQWEQLDSFAPTWRSGTTSINELRRWSAPLVLGSPALARYVTANLRSRLPFRRRLSRTVRRLRSSGRPGKKPT